MQKLHEEIVINAPREKVWESIITKELYEKWTKPFNENSTFEGEWKEGNTIRFLGSEEDGTKSGMIAQIAKMQKPSFISIKHVGIIDHGVEKMEGPEVDAWAPSFENYTLKEIEAGETKFEVDMDIDEQYQDMFKEMWPKALNLLKEISER